MSHLRSTMAVGRNPCIQYHSNDNTIKWVYIGLVLHKEEHLLNYTWLGPIKWAGKNILKKNNVLMHLFVFIWIFFTYLIPLTPRKPVKIKRDSLRRENHMQMHELMTLKLCLLGRTTSLIQHCIGEGYWDWQHHPLRNEIKPEPTW